jgi:hypothetical protein
VVIRWVPLAGGSDFNIGTKSWHSLSISFQCPVPIFIVCRRFAPGAIGGSFGPQESCRVMLGKHQRLKAAAIGTWRGASCTDR